MSKNKTIYVGIDMGSQNFYATILKSPDSTVVTEEFSNNTEGFIAFSQWLEEHNVKSRNTILCLESCGVYAESFAHYFYALKYKVIIEAPLKVKKAFKESEHKTDAVDSRQIAEYAYRYRDKLTRWQPREEIMEKIQHLISAREQYVKQKVALQNALTAYERHTVKVELIVKSHKEHIEQIENTIKSIERELAKFLDNDPDIKNKSSILKSTPGFGMLIVSNLLLMMHQQKDLTYKQLSAYLGLCPYKYQSGTSVHKKDRTRGYGPSIMRKLLRLAAQSAATHNKTFRHYYLRKLKEGKAKALVLNNIANKMLKLAFAMLKNNKRYVDSYQSVNPIFI